MEEVFATSHVVTYLPPLCFASFFRCTLSVHDAHWCKRQHDDHD